MALKWPDKDPNEVLDYLINWAGTEEKPGRLVEGDAIASSTWIVPSGITKDSDTFDDETTTIWLSGGTLGETYELTNRIVTDGLRTMDQTMKIKIKAK